MIRVMASSVIGAPVEKVWALVRDFNGLPAWLPAVVSSVIEEGGAPDRVGSVRALTMGDGGKMREQLLGLSDAEHSVTFAIIESALPIKNYKSTIRLQSVTDGDQSYITWQSEFEVVGDHEDELKRQMPAQIYQPGFDTLKERFKTKRGPDPA